MSGGHLRVRTEPGWHCPEFGCREASSVLETEATSELPCEFGWFIALQKDQRDPELLSGENGGCSLQFETAGVTEQFLIPM